MSKDIFQYWNSNFENNYKSTKQNDIHDSELKCNIQKILRI